jgi:hypothetical protein
MRRRPAGAELRGGTAAVDSGLPGQLGFLGVGRRPGEALNELLGGVTVAEVYGVDTLVEQHGCLLARLPVVADPR